MIQRIQSLWIVVAVVLIVVALFQPLATYTFTMEGNAQQVASQFGLCADSTPGQHIDVDADGQSTFSYGQQSTDVSLWPLWLLAGLSLLAAVVGLLLYRNRMLQVRVLLGAFLLNVVYDIVLLFWAVDAYADHLTQHLHGTDMHVVWQVGAYLPIVSIVFFVLAVRAIRKDEARVRAADRLR